MLIRIYVEVDRYWIHGGEFESFIEVFKMNMYRHMKSIWRHSNTARKDTKFRFHRFSFQFRFCPKKNFLIHILPKLSLNTSINENYLLIDSWATWCHYLAYDIHDRFLYHQQDFNNDWRDISMESDTKLITHNPD